MRERKRVIAVDEYEYSIIMRALNDYRNKAIANEVPTKELDSLILRIIDAREKSVKTANDR